MPDEPKGMTIPDDDADREHLGNKIDPLRPDNEVASDDEVKNLLVKERRKPRPKEEAEAAEPPATEEGKD